MGISRNPTMAGSTQTAASMTWRELLGQQIFQKIRALGQSNPSNQYLQAQQAAAFAAAFRRPALEVVRLGFTSKLRKQPAASAWYGDNYAAIVGTGIAPNINPVYADIVMTKGTMTNTPYTTAGVASAGAKTVTLHFRSGNFDSTQLDTDTALIAVYNQTTNIMLGFAGVPGTDTRVALSGNDTISTPTGFLTLGDQLVVYLGWFGAPSTINAGTSSTSVNEVITVIA